MKQVSPRPRYDHDSRWWAFATLSVAVFISILDLFIVNIAFPDIERQWPDSGLIGGAGVGLILPTFTSAAVLAVPAERLTTGIAAETTFRQIGAALAIAAWVALYGTPTAADVLDAFDRGFAYMAACSLAAALTLLALARQGAANHA